MKSLTPIFQVPPVYVHCDAYWRRDSSDMEHVDKRGMNETRVVVIIK